MCHAVNTTCVYEYMCVLVMLLSHYTRKGMFVDTYLSARVEVLARCIQWKVFRGSLCRCTSCTGGAREALACAGVCKPVQKSLHIYLCPKFFVQPT